MKFKVILEGLIPTEPKKGDYFETEKYEYIPITKIDKIKKSIGVLQNKDGKEILYGYDFWNLEFTGKKNGKAVWKFKIKEIK